MTNGNFIDGVIIISKYITEERKDGCDIHAGHDQFWFGEFHIIPEGKDKERLLELNWFEDEDSWSCFP